MATRTLTCAAGLLLACADAGPSGNSDGLTNMPTATPDVVEPTAPPDDTPAAPMAPAPSPAIPSAPAGMNAAPPPAMQPQPAAPSQPAPPQPAMAGSAAPLPAQSNPPVEPQPPQPMQPGLSMDGEVMTNWPHLTIINEGHADLVITTAYFQLGVASMRSAGLVENRGSQRHCVGGFSVADLGTQQLGIVAIVSANKYDVGGSLPGTCLEPGETGLWRATTLPVSKPDVSVATEFRYAIVPADNSGDGAVIHPAAPSLSGGRWNETTYTATLTTPDADIHALRIEVWALDGNGFPRASLMILPYPVDAVPRAATKTVMEHLMLGDFSAPIQDTFIDINWVDGPPST